MEIPWDPEITRQWLPVNLYFGGAEHSVLHLMYARFVTMVLYDLKMVKFEEPFPKFYAHGLMIKDGAKMSKSRGNVVNPDIYIEKFGADTLRLYLMFMGPMDGYPDFRDTGIEGMARFVGRIWKCFKDKKLVKKEDASFVNQKTHQVLQKVTEDIKEFKYNTSIAATMELVNVISEKGADEDILKILTKLLAPFAPHLTEELWHEYFGEKSSIHISDWPKFDPDLIMQEYVTIPVQVNGKLRGTIRITNNESRIKEKVINLAKEDQKIKEWIKDKQIKKEIFVPGKLVNFVV